MLPPLLQTPFSPPTQRKRKTRMYSIYIAHNNVQSVLLSDQKRPTSTIALFGKSYRATSAWVLFGVPLPTDLDLDPFFWDQSQPTWT